MLQQPEIGQFRQLVRRWQTPIPHLSWHEFIDDNRANCGIIEDRLRCDVVWGKPEQSATLACRCVDQLVGLQKLFDDQMAIINAQIVEIVTLRVSGQRSVRRSFSTGKPVV